MSQFQKVSTISIVTPVYMAQSCLSELYERLEKVLAGITDDFEIIMVNDSSPDQSWEVIKTLSKKDPRVLGLNLSRNFGQHYAITAGLSSASKQWVVVMDCDLQDQPEEIPKFFQSLGPETEVVLAQRVDRQDSFIKKLFSKLFYRALSWLTGTEQDASIANFGLYHRKVIKAVLSSRESIRYFPTMVKWAGFNTKKVPVEHAARASGESSYNLKKLLRLALDIILAYSDKPLRMTVKMGLLISLVSFTFGLYTIYRAFIGEIEVLGYASLIVSIWMLSGVVIFILGVLGLYLGKTFEVAKGRPSFIVSNRTDEMIHND